MSFSRSRLPVWLHTLLVAALLWAPLWGQWHGVAHGTGQALSVPAGLDGARAHQDAVHESHSNALGHEAGADLCRVLDHLSQAERLSAACSPGLAPMGAMALPIFRLVFSPDQDLWSLALARAPPVLI